MVTCIQLNVTYLKVTKLLIYIFHQKSHCLSQYSKV